MIGGSRQGNEKRRILYIPFVSDTDFRLQFAAVFQLLRGAAQSPGDRRDFTSFTGTYLFLSRRTSANPIGLFPDSTMRRRSWDRKKHSLGNTWAFIGSFRSERLWAQCYFLRKSRDDAMILMWSNTWRTYLANIFPRDLWRTQSGLGISFVPWHNVIYVYELHACSQNKLKELFRAPSRSTAD